MSDTDDMLLGAFGNAGKNAVRATRNKDNSPEVFFMLISLLLVLVIVGAEGMKIIFRTNFGSKGIKFWRILICTACFGFIPYKIYSGYYFGYDSDSENTAVSFYITGLAYALIALFILIKGTIVWIRAQKDLPNSNYQGDSSVFGLLKDYGFSTNQMRYLAEPLYTIMIGAMLYIYNPLAGIPIFFCGISIWVNALIDIFSGSFFNEDMGSTYLDSPNSPDSIILTD